jgi:hypothetical protein
MTQKLNSIPGFRPLVGFLSTTLSLCVQLDQDDGEKPRSSVASWLQERLLVTLSPFIIRQLHDHKGRYDELWGKAAKDRYKTSEVRTTIYISFYAATTPVPGRYPSPLPG